MRKLVTVRKIDSLRPIPDADAIECARIGGWDVVVKKHEFQVGDDCIYFEIDSFLPEDDYRFQFMMKNKITWQGKVGARLRTVKLRGQVSQGLALPTSSFPEIEQIYNYKPMDQDFAELLRVEKWEPVIPAQLAGKIKGMFPSFIQKTDQERAQNIPFGNLLLAPADKGEKPQPRFYEVSIKLEGSSMTAYCKDGEIGVCSRNLELKLDDTENSFVRALYADKGKGSIADWMLNIYRVGNRNFAYQFELMGPGIQGNHEGLTEITPFLFDVYDIDRAEYKDADFRTFLLLNFPAPFEHVPVIDTGRLSDLGIESMDQLIAYADGPSLNHKNREGLVFKDLDEPSFSFKVISNKYLLKEK